MEPKNKKKFSDYWKRLFRSTREKLSRGASNIAKTISRARNENWRRSDKKDKK